MNPVYMLIAQVLDLLSGGSLEYAQPHGRFDSRIDAGMALIEAGKISPTDTPGCYIVTSETGKEQYYVSALYGDLSCTCEDATMPVAKNAPPRTGICKHQIAAVVYEAQIMVFAQMDAMEQGAA